MTVASSFLTRFGTSIQGMDVLWRQHNVVAGTVAPADKLYLEFTLNLYNMLDLSTGVGQAADIAGTPLLPVLQFYLTVVNPDQSTIATLPYDAFVGLLQFTGISLATSGVNYNDGVTGGDTYPVDKISYFCITKTPVTPPTAGTSVPYGADWTGNKDGTLKAKDVANDIAYTCEGSYYKSGGGKEAAVYEDPTIKTAWIQCQEWLVVDKNNVQCAKARVAYSRTFKTTDTSPFYDVEIKAQKYAIAAGWNLIKSGTDIQTDAAVILSTNYFDTTQSTSVNFGTKVVDFGAFELPDPITTYEGAYQTLQATVAAAAAACLLSSF